jgi:glycosyltransferase involved in cell wall biosynthesis
MDNAKFQLLHSNVESFKPLGSMVIPLRDDTSITNLIDSLSKSDSIGKIEVCLMLNSPSEEIRRLTQTIVESNVVPYLQVIEVSNPISVGDVRNIGIECANSPYIIHMDSDCILGDQYIELMLAAASEGVDIAVPVVLRDPGDTPATRVIAQHFLAMASDLRGRFLNPGLGIRRGLHLQGHLYSTNILVSDDREFMAQMASENPNIKFIPEAVIIHKAEDPAKSAKQIFRYGIDKGKISEIFPFADDSKLRIQWIRTCIMDNSETIQKVMNTQGNLLDLYLEICTQVDNQNSGKEVYDLTKYLQMTGFISSLAFGYYLRNSTNVHPQLQELREAFLALHLETFDKMIPKDWIPQNYIY